MSFKLITPLISHCDKVFRLTITFHLPFHEIKQKVEVRLDTQVAVYDVKPDEQPGNNDCFFI